jgi:hypothetical protein
MRFVRAVHVSQLSIEAIGAVSVFHGVVDSLAGRDGGAAAFDYADPKVHHLMKHVALCMQGTISVVSLAAILTKDYE